MVAGADPIRIARARQTVFSGLISVFSEGMFDVAPRRITDSTRSQGAPWSHPPSALALHDIPEHARIGFAAADRGGLSPDCCCGPPHHRADISPVSAHLPAGPSPRPPHCIAAQRPHSAPHAARPPATQSKARVLAGRSVRHKRIRAPFSIPATALRLRNSLKFQSPAPALKWSYKKALSTF